MRRGAREISQARCAVTDDISEQGVPMAREIAKVPGIEDPGRLADWISSQRPAQEIGRAHV